MDEPDDDATVVEPRASAPSRRPRVLAVAIGATVLGAFGWYALRPGARPAVTASTTAPSSVIRPVAATPARPPAAPAPVLVAPADEQAILAARSPSLLVFRYAPDPSVLVLSFPSLLAQGRMLNRLGAFVEKSGLPRTRVLPEDELREAFRRSHDTEETFYYGHDYRAADMARFFAVAAHDGTDLRPEETRLRVLLAQQGLLTQGATGALISIPPESRDPPVDAAARATILHHELSHGLYFTDPAYAGFVRAFWATGLTTAQRDGFRRFLAAQGYDTTNDDLMANETQAYLMHTPDRRYFRPALAGLTMAEADALRRSFLLGMPGGWLRDADTVSLGTVH